MGRIVSEMIYNQGCRVGKNFSINLKFSKSIYLKFSDSSMSEKTTPTPP